MYPEMEKKTKTLIHKIDQIAQTKEQPDLVESML